jgi:hypothetical protein
MQELGGHQIVRSCRLPLLKVALFLVDAAGNLARSLGVNAFAVQSGFFVRGCPFKRDGGNVDGGDGPALLSEPDGVGPFAAAQVQCLPRPQSSSFADQLRVRLYAPELGLAAVSFVPCLGGTVLRLVTEARAAVVRLVAVVVCTLLRHASSLRLPGIEGNAPHRAPYQPN